MAAEAPAVVINDATTAHQMVVNADGSINTTPAGGSTGNVNITQVSGNSVSTVATGTQKVGVVGNTGATLDATLAPGTAPTNGAAVLGQFNTAPPSLANLQTSAIQLDANGNLRAAQALVQFSDVDGLSNVNAGVPYNSGAVTGVALVIYPHFFNGSTWDRVRTAGIGNNVAATGIAAASSYAQFLNNANQPALSTGNYASLQLTPDGAVRTAPQRPATTDILVGYQTFTSTTGATTLITVPAGRTWVGTLSANCACQEVAAGTAAAQARCVFSTSGATVTPAAGSYFAVEAKAGANAASGLVGTQAANFGSTPFTVTAPVGNTALIQVTVTIAGTAGVVDASAIGNLQ